MSFLGYEKNIGCLSCSVYYDSVFPIDKTNPPPTPGMDFLKIKKHHLKLPKSLPLHAMIVILTKQNTPGILTLHRLHGF